MIASPAIWWVKVTQFEMRGKEPWVSNIVIISNVLCQSAQSTLINNPTDRKNESYAFLWWNISVSVTCNVRTCCGWLLTLFAAAITANAAFGLPVIGLAANKAWWCDCTCCCTCCWTCCCLFKWCCNCWCCKCAAATAAGKWGWWWLIVAVSEAIE